MDEARLGRLHAPWLAPSDACIFAVGDIHGRDDLAALMLERIEVESADLIEAGRQPIAVFLGDYIDRGPQSRAVLERLAHWAPPGVQRHFLRGNHEQSLMLFLEAPGEHRSWLNHGGLETLLSYDVRPPSLGADAERLKIVAEALRAAMAPTHLDFLERLRDHLILGDYLFVHAGVDPRKGVSRQSPRDLLWIRARFLRETALYDYCVVHGHTPAPTPYLDGRRIGVDTGAYATGKLSAARLEGVSVRFLSVEAHPERTSRPLDPYAVQF